MKTSPKRNHSKSQNLQPRNESITVMLCAVEKKDFIEKCEALNLLRSEQGRNLILNWIYAPAETNPVLLEADDLKEVVKDQSKLIGLWIEKSIFYRMQAGLLRKFCLDNGIELPPNVNCKFNSEKNNELKALHEKIGD